jgi:putative ABC transport system permease protein
VAAGLRAAVQLTAVSVVIGVVVTHLPLLVLFVALMYAVAVRTCGRRLRQGPSTQIATPHVRLGIVALHTICGSLT